MKRNLLAMLLLILTIPVALAQKTNYKEKAMELTAKDKFAIVMVHFGSTNQNARTNTIELINREVAKEFKNATVVEAYTSRIVIKLLAKEGIAKLTPAQQLEQLYKQGYTHVILQTTHITDGVEMESLKRDAEPFITKFKDLRIGRPLLYTPAYYKSTISALKKQVKTNSDAVVLVGHGTYEAITASYAMLDYMLKMEGLEHWSVATIEGYPSFDEGLVMLSKAQAKSVCLVPLMFVAGVHAVDDIQGEWSDILRSKGYEVEVLMKGLGENSAIRDIYSEHIKFAMNNIELDIMKKKQEYSK